MGTAERDLPQDIQFTPRESFLRWQEFAYNQLGTASSIMLVVALAILGSSANFADFALWLDIAMVAGAGLSIFFGAALHNNRFSAFQVNLAITRRTWSAERRRHGGETLQSDVGKTPEQLEAENEKARLDFKKHEDKAFRCFETQAWTLAIAMSALALGWALQILL